MAERTTEECIAEGHQVSAQWPIWYGHSVELRKDADGVDFVAVLTEASRSIDDSGGDTEWWCYECDEVQAPTINIEYV
jgi:hypothetical protein